MKKTFLGLLLLMGQLALAQSTLTFPPSGKLATEAYVDSVVKAAIRGKVTVLEPCDEGPELRTITNITEDSLVASFHGKNVFGLDFHIVGDMGVVEMGSIKPKSSNLVIRYKALPAGTYKLRLYGNTCQGKSEKVFVIPTVPINGDRKESFNQAPKLLFDISTAEGLYTDVTAGDYQENGQRYRDANGRKYRVFYFLNEIPWKNSDDTPRDFSNVELRNGLTVSIRKVYAQANWVSTFSALIHKQHEAWYENKGADENLTYRTAFQYIITAGGQDLNTGQLNRFQNPDWLDPTKLTPQYWKHDAPALPNKAVIMQCFTTTGSAQETSDRLRASGVTHLWENTMMSAGLASVQNPLKVAQNYTTALFGSHNPTKEKVEGVADSKQLYDDMWITDEFAEGDYGQWGNNTSLWFYDRLNQRALSEKKKIHLVGEYGAQSLSIYQNFKVRHNDRRDPVSPYLLSLLGPDVVDKLIEEAGNKGTALKHYAQSRSSYMGRVVGGYYSAEQFGSTGPQVGVGDWIISMPFQAVLHYNVAPQQPTLFFTWPKMQSNYAMIDMPQRDPGTLRPDGTVVTDFPMTPLEISKVHGFMACLLFDALYIWNDGGHKPDDENLYRQSGIGTDAIMVGVHWFTAIQEQAAQGDVYACDYSANDITFASTATERRVPKRGQPRYGNRYFNDVAQAQRGMALCLPGPKKAFVYINPYLSPVEVENVHVTFEGKEYDLGEVPGMTLAVGREK